MAFSHTYNSQNVDGDKGGKLKPILAGEYPVRIVKSEDAVSQKTGKDMIRLELEIMQEPYRGRKLFQYIVDDQYADQKIHDILTSCRKDIPATVTSGTFFGLVGKVKTKATVYNGEQRAEVHYWIRPKAGEAAPSNAKDGLPF